MKRFSVTSITRDREYDLTQGKPGSRVLYFTANPNGEAEVVKVVLKPNPKLKKIFFDRDFSQLAIKGRQSMGNLLTKLDVSRITLKSHGGSTLGGRKVWFDFDVHRLNYDEQGTYLGEFNNDDKILVVLDNADFYITNFDANNHYEDNIARIEKYDPDKVWTAALLDAEQGGYLYVKRFKMEATARHQNYLGENPGNRLLLLTDTPYPHLLVTMGGTDSFRAPIDMEAEEFVGVKSFKARGKRVTTFAVERVEELDPTRQPESDADASTPADAEEPAPGDADEGQSDTDQEESQQDVLDEMTGQLHMFDE